MISTILFSVLSNAHGQSYCPYCVSITNLHYPTSVVYGSSELIRIDLTVVYRAVRSGPGLVVSLYDQTKGPFGSINGTDVVVTGDPYPLASGGKGPPSCTGVLGMVGMMGVPLKSSENFHFMFSSSHVPDVSSWTINVAAVLLSDLVFSTSNFTISVTHLTSTSTSSTPTLQMPQPPQQTATESTATQSTGNMSLVALALAAIAVVALIVLILFSRRKKEPKVTKTEKIDTDTTRLPTKAAEGKKFCIECGNELPLNLSFCDSCGTKVLKQ